MKHFANFQEEHSDGNFVKFLKQFLKELTKNYTKTWDKFREKLQRNSEEILENFEALLKINPGTLQGLILHYSQMRN